MKEIIKSVLSRYKNSQINLASDSSVDLIASEIEAVLVKNKYVLSKFTKEEGKIVNNINNLAEDIISAIVFQSISFAMNTFNSKIQ